MPVQLNEPLNTLQRLCEELEYSELLDRAANTQDPFERMVRWQISFCLSALAVSKGAATGKASLATLWQHLLKKIMSKYVS